MPKLAYPNGHELQHVQSPPRHNHLEPVTPAQQLSSIHCLQTHTVNWPQYKGSIQNTEAFYARFGHLQAHKLAAQEPNQENMQASC